MEVYNARVAATPKLAVNTFLFRLHNSQSTIPFTFNILGI